MTDQIASPRELARQLDRSVAEWIANALDGEVDHERAKQIFETCGAAAATALLLDERQAQLDSQEEKNS